MKYLIIFFICLTTTVAWGGCILVDEDAAICGSDGLCRFSINPEYICEEEKLEETKYYNLDTKRVLNDNELKNYECGQYVELCHPIYDEYACKYDDTTFYIYPNIKPKLPEKLDCYWVHNDIDSDEMGCVVTIWQIKNKINEIINYLKELK